MTWSRPYHWHCSMLFNIGVNVLELLYKLFYLHVYFVTCIYKWHNTRILRLCISISYVNVRTFTSVFGLLRQCSDYYVSVRTITSMFGLLRQCSDYYLSVRTYVNVRTITSMFGLWRHSCYQRIFNQLKMCFINRTEHYLYLFESLLYTHQN